MRLNRAAGLAGLVGALILARPSVSYGQYLEAYFPRGVPGYGQELGVDVLSRLRPLYEEPGIRAGSFIIRPQLAEAIGYDSNPAGFSSGAGSGVLRTSPSLAVNSDWSRDSLGANLAVDSHRYWDTPRQSYTNWSASIGGGYTIGRSDLTLAYSHLSLHQTAGSIGAVPSDTPVHFQVDDLRAAYTFNLGRLSFTPNVDVRNYYFDNTTILGIPTSQQYRNRAVLSGGVTTRYSLSDLRSLLFVLQGVDSHHTTPQLGEPSYNSKSFLALGGLDYEALGAWRYQLLAGVEVRAFQSPAFKTHTAPVAEGSLIWTPTGLTTVTGTLARVIEAAAAEGTAGYTYTTARLILDHEYLRNVLLQARAGAQVAQYLQGGGSQTSFSIGAGVNWLMNRNMRLSADYDFTTQTGANIMTFNGRPNLTTLNTGSYIRNVFLVAMHFGL